MGRLEAALGHSVKGESNGDNQGISGQDPIP